MARLQREGGKKAFLICFEEEKFQFLCYLRKKLYAVGKACL